MDPSRADRWDWPVVAALLTVAAALRFFRLGSAPLWLDEAMSARFAAAPLGDLPALLAPDSGPPLYYLLLRGWTVVAGVSEVSLRALSAACGVAVVALVIAVGRRVFDRETAVAAGFAVAWSPLAVALSREARGYALLSLLALVASATLWRHLEGGRRLDLALHGASLAAALYVHNYAFLLAPVVVTQAALSLPSAADERRRRLRDLALVWAAVVVVYLPWLPTFRAQLGATGFRWMGAVWEAHGALGSLGASVASLSPGGAQPAYLGARASTWGMSAPLWLVSALAVLGASRIARTKRDGRAFGVLAGTVLPGLLAAGAGVAGMAVYLPGRLDALALPFFALVVGNGIAALRRRTLQVAALAAYAALSWTAIRPLEPLDPGGERAIADLLATRGQAGDVVVATSLTRAPVELALELRAGSKPSMRWRSFPAELDAHLGNVDAEALAARRDALAAEAASLLPELAADPGWSGRILLLAVPDAVTGVLVEALLARPRSRPDVELGHARLSRLGLPVDVFLLDYGR